MTIGGSTNQRQIRVLGYELDMRCEGTPYKKERFFLQSTCVKEMREDVVGP